MAWSANNSGGLITRKWNILIRSWSDVARSHIFNYT